MARKYTDSSRGDLTGFQRTIERAPTMPRLSAISPEITLVMTNVIIGKFRGRGVSKSPYPSCPASTKLFANQTSTVQDRDGRKQV